MGQHVVLALLAHGKIRSTDGPFAPRLVSFLEFTELPWEISYKREGQSLPLFSMVYRLTKRPLFGGAIDIDVPCAWRDVSEVRQVPDHQE